MATVSGVWVFNADVYIDNTGNVEEAVNFTSNGDSFMKMYYSYYYDGDSDENVWLLTYYHTTSLSGGSVSVWGGDDGGNPLAWVDENYKTVDFGNIQQTVSDEFYSFLTDNATKQAEPVPTPDWANCFVKTSAGNKAVEKVWIKQNGELVQIFGEQELQKTYAFQWNRSSSNWWNNYLHLVLNDTDYNKPPKTFPDLTSGVATPIKLWEEDDKSNMGQGRFALYDSSGQLITPIEFVGANCDSEGYFYLPSYLGEINGTITPPYYENGATVIFEYK